ncbi:efflux RND transporter periplasmic adaptor subunit [Vibrio cyclitrophicus]|uniref:Efflux transporter periplasmic adaptor subunit n=3 Tax=Vibrio cyclitrophicus TaxID=47951 RepID=A0A7Z1MIK5_9VIBR|nr:efflux RND transporter periplasmic adaptor subunit [Vibrio cyclitrophicus]PMF09635.1 efflux transporter periplasmic adaptor subunit [Vibrio cyclitrophicus]PMJ55110.1 efflux transporter periplasmic adaptor subunit [Vibrio cyclitrophicus]PMP22257.1 efflux transporter periplasmic adaptor subunit [Vibrio cyclitrophicus]PMP29032.1 efflux transporter periplasmic adaptor subunit [Vibrio cyclitrophicus]
MQSNLSIETSLRKNALLAIATIMLAGSLTGCNKAQSEETIQVVKPVKLFEIPQQSDVDLDSFIANVDATDRAALSFQVSGDIEIFSVRMGQEVKKGQVLAALDATDYRIALDAAQARFDLANSQFKQASKLYAKKLVSTDYYDQALNTFTAAEVELDQAKTNLGYTTLVAPFDGVVSMVFGKQYQLIAEKQPVLNILNHSEMDVTFSIPVSKLEDRSIQDLTSSNMWVVMDSHRGIRIPTRFKEISTQPDEDTNSYQAVVSIVKPDGINLLSGMTAQVEVQKSKSQLGIGIVDSAWLSRETNHGELWRYSPESQLISKVQVSLDPQGNVIDGLSPGDLIVEAGVDVLSEGQQVKAWQREGGI